MYIYVYNNIDIYHLSIQYGDYMLSINQAYTLYLGKETRWAKSSEAVWEKKKSIKEKVKKGNKKKS